jgi:hypothetical protein
MFRTFVTTEDEQINAVHMIALASSKQENLMNFCNVMIQLFFNQGIVQGKAVLNWLSS